jgi:hypothetical protein
MNKSEGSGNNHKLVGQVVTFRREVSISVKNGSTSSGHIKIHAGTVGTLTGGFINKKVNGRLTTFLDVKINLLENHYEFSRRYLMLVSVSLDVLQFGTKDEVN